jgi:5-methylcytosine-specific restriction endonuclease McrA
MIETKKARYRIIERDEFCLVCGRVGTDLHEIIPRSMLLPGNAQLCWSEKNRCLLCRQCHNKAHTVEYRKKILLRMKLRYGYKYEEQVYKRYEEAGVEAPA